MLATRSPTNSLLEPPIGIAPRFPKLKSFLKSYTLGWENWESKSIPLLQRYGAEGAGFEFSKIGDTTITYSFNHAGSDLQMASMGLRWHALQAALASNNDTKKRAAKTPVRDMDAAVADIESNPDRKDTLAR